MDWWEKCPKFNKRTGMFIKDLSVVDNDIDMEPTNDFKPFTAMHEN